MDIAWTCDGGIIRAPGYSEKNIEEATKNNETFRNVVYVDKNVEVTLYVLRPGWKIPFEQHDASQFVRVEQGVLQIVRNGRTEAYGDGGAAVIAPNERHYLGNPYQDTCKFYAIYSPPQHEMGLKEDYIEQDKHDLVPFDYQKSFGPVPK